MEHNRNNVNKNLNVKLKIIGFLFIFFFVLLIGQQWVQQKAQATMNHSVKQYVPILFNEESGFPASTANDVLQTRDGYLWYATYSGLVRYDGRNYKLINNTTEPDFAGTGVRTLFEDSKGRLWIGTNESGIICYENGEYTTFDKNDGVPANSIRMITEGLDGYILAASTAGLFKIDENSNVEIFDIQKLTENFLNDILITEDEFLIGVSDRDELLVFKNSVQIPSFGSGNGLEKYKFTCVSTHENETFYLGTTGNVIFEFIRDGNKYIFTKREAGDLSSINDIYYDSKGKLWVCADNGIGYFENNSFHEIKDISMNNSVERIYEDYEGSLWFASSRQGVLQLSESRFVNFSEEHRLDELVVNSTAIYNNKTYIGTDTGLVVIDEAGKQVINEITTMLDGIRIRCLLVDSTGHLWICTYQDYGIIRYSANGSYINYNLDSGLFSNKIRSAIETARGDILVAADNTISVIRDGKIIKSYNKENGMGDTGILSLYEDKKGVIYVGTDGDGVLRIEGDVITTFNEDDGLASGVVLRMKGDPNTGGIWASTGNSLCYIDESGVRKIKKFSTVGSIFDIVFAENNKMWIITENELIITKSEDLLGDEVPLQWESIKKKSGLSSSITANSWPWLEEDGILYLCCSTGVNCINTLDYETGSENVPLIINEVSIDDVIFKNPIGEIEVSKNAMRLTINAALLSYMPSKAYTITYFLEGQDQEEESISMNDLSEITYTNLKGGHYTFYMTVFDSRGNKIGNGIVLNINKEFKLFERISNLVALIALIILATLLLTITLMNMKAKRLRQRQLEYKIITEQSISAIANTIDAKDPYTKGHSMRVAKYSVEIAKRLKMDEAGIEHIYYTALLHDIGKIGIPDSILKKPSKLTEEEYEIIKTHTRIGNDILKDITAVKDIARGAKEHHERYDGNGYNGIAGEEISLEGRIICVADTYDAMTSKRAYRDAITGEKILQEFIRCRGTQFDPKIADIVIEMIKEGAFKKMQMS